MTKIYVGNLSFDTTEDELRDVFAKFGSVDTVDIIKDRMTGRPRGFAFVEMSDGQEAQQAMEKLNGSELGGRPLNVNEAKPRTDRPRSGGGGGGFRSPGGNRGGGGGGRGGRGGGGGGRRW